jgi:hypothetical protein
MRRHPRTVLEQDIELGIVCRDHAIEARRVAKDPMRTDDAIAGAVRKRLAAAGVETVGQDHDGGRRRAGPQSIERGIEKIEPFTHGNADADLAHQ